MYLGMFSGDQDRPAIPAVDRYVYKALGCQSHVLEPFLDAPYLALSFSDQLGNVAHAVSLFQPVDNLLVLGPPAILAAFFGHDYRVDVGHGSPAGADPARPSFTISGLEYQFRLLGFQGKVHHGIMGIVVCSALPAAPLVSV